MRNAIILSAALVMLTVPSWADTWDGGGADNHWNTDLNWTDDTKPTSSDSVTLSTDDVAELHGAAVSTSFTMSGNSTLDVYAGATYQKSGSSGFEIVGSGTTWAVLTQHGGIMNLYWDMRLGYHSTSGDDIHTSGRYIISGGSLIIPRGATAGVAYSGYRDDTCLGEFIVDGGDADLIDIHGFTVDDSTHSTGARSKLEFKFDGDTDPIQQIDVAGNVTLGGILKITDDAGTTPDGKYILIEYTGALTISADLDATQIPADWKVYYDVDSDGDGNNEVTVTVPEPATMALLCIGGLGVLVRRRKR